MASSEIISNNKLISNSVNNKSQATGPKNIRVFIDMENVVCDFEYSLMRAYRRKYPREPYIPLDQRKGISVKKQYSDIREDLGERIASIYNAPRFFRDLSEVPGACVALKDMDKLYGIDVFIYSSVAIPYEYSLKEKCQWVEFHLGLNWLDRIIFVKDPTLLNGNVLIDDKVTIKGAVKCPKWEHVVFTTCHNAKMNVGTKKRLENWTDGSWRHLINQARYDA